MSAEPSQRLRLVDDNGEVRDYTGCPRCKEVQLGDVENLEAANRKLHRQVKSMQRDRAAERLTDPRRWEILRLIEHWKQATGHPKAKASADRFDLVKARLAEGYSVEEVELAIEGLGAFPYVGPQGRMKEGEPKQRHDRLGIALDGGEALERFANLGAEERGWGRGA